MKSFFLLFAMMKINLCRWKLTCAWLCNHMMMLYGRNVCNNEGISLFMFAPRFPELEMNKNRARAVGHENAICVREMGADFTVVGGRRARDRCGDSVDSFLSMTL